MMKVQTKTPRKKQELQIQADTPISHSKAKQHTGHAGINPQTRHHMIAEAAYYLAEKRGFSAGSAMRDWLVAEAQINTQLLERASGIE